ncbi:efflux RND transporter permease subunit [Thermoflexibacter ruber]|uniref:Cobalt-zinc-cadmium resistance protein CzcA n=1 Tax=Thermoflexibacter ruber TaxID=1003 RepID=A0A1I2J0I4_9BACT|nr:CusA/CzcA family heavy metal efflux RND transporter [Thermoflexibacter ruber]SFF47510.1 cobalt-zinc-cadmium resistance protein CzcA [Thermoflexibacter ruber]
MINKILIFSFRNPATVIIGALALMLVGYYAFTELKIEAYPDISDTNVTIITTYEGRAAEEVEQQVTIPIERALNSVPRVLSRRSRTIFGLSVVQLTFTDGTDDFYARQVVLEKLQAAEIPDEVQPELAPLTTPVGEIFRYIVENKGDFTPMEIRTLQDWVIKPALLQVQGVADVTTFGGPIKEFHILTSPEQLKHYDLNLNDLIDAVEKNNKNTGGNVIQRGGQGFAVRGIGTLRNEKDIENIVVKAVDGVPIFMRDVAKIEIAPPNPSGIFGYTVTEEDIDSNTGTEGIVLAIRGENPSELLKKLQAKIQELQTNELPNGIRLRIIYSRAELVGYTLKTVSHTLIEGLIIVVVVLIFFLSSLRSALIVAITIPISLLFAFLMMQLVGIPANLLSLGAIDFGIIVDGACVMAAALVRKVKEAEEKRDAQDLVVRDLCEISAKEIGQEIFFTVLIIILAYLPLFTLQRVEGKLFSPMAYTLSFGVIGGLICALTIIPVLISLAYKNYLKKKRRLNIKNYLLVWLEKGYEKLLPLLLTYCKPFLIATFGGVIFIYLTVLPQVGTEFLPELDEGSIFARCFLPSGVSIQENAKIAPIIRKVISKHTQVKNVFTQTGRNDDGTDPFAPNRTEIMISLKDYSLWAADTTKQELISQIRYELQTALPGAYFSFGQPIIDQVSEVVTGSAADLAISIIGDDLTLMRKTADSIVSIVREIQGASETGIEQEGIQTQLSIEIDRESAARYGINVSDIQLMIEAAIGGKIIGTVYEGARRFDIKIRFLPEYRDNIDVIKNLLINSPSGARIPLYQLAEIKLIDGQTNITRLNGKRLIAVRTNVRGRDQGGFVAECQKKIDAQIHLPKGYSIEYGGQFENLERAGKRLMLVIPLTFVLVGVLLFTLYRNLQDTLITILCVPLAALGGVIALLMRGYNFNVSAGVGFVSLFGVSVMAGVLLVSAYERKKKAGFYDFKKLVLQASVHELRPILMMLFVAIIGLIPAARSTGIGSDVQRPLATVIIGGLTTTLIFVPFIIPTLYYFLDWKSRKRK